MLHAMRERIHYMSIDLINKGVSNKQTIFLISLIINVSLKVAEGGEPSLETPTCENKVPVFP